MIEAFAPYFLQMIGHMNDANQICKVSIDVILELLFMSVKRFFPGPSIEI